MTQSQLSFGRAQVAQKQSEWSLIQQAEAARKRRAEIDRARQETELAANATPETLRHHRVCVATRMFDRGQLTAEQLQAAREISDVFMAITRRLFAHTSSFGGIGGSNDFLPPSLCAAHSERYKPWSDDQSRIFVRHRVSRVDLVHMVVVDNHGAEQLRQRLGMDRQRVVAQVRESLYRYAELARWLPINQTAEIAGQKSAA